MCFARRRVSLVELYDAITMIRSSDSRDKKQKPFPSLVQELLSPLIVLEGEQSSQGYRCRLFHSTIKAFVQRNPFVLADDANNPESVAIDPSRIARLCLQYLSQSRYRNLLILQDGAWKDALGEPIDNDELLQYAAKYWDKHLEDVRPTPPALLERTCKFVLSANFQTLLQIQNLYVSGHFMVFTRTGVPERFKFLRRVFPIWLVRERALIDSAQLWKDYRSFMHEWSYLIGCGCCESPKCLKKLFAGEIDRVMFGALGSDSFLSRLRSRYMSFKLSANEACGIQSSRQCYEGYSECGRTVYLAQFL